MISAEISAAAGSAISVISASTGPRSFKTASSLSASTLASVGTSSSLAASTLASVGESSSSIFTSAAASSSAERNVPFHQWGGLRSQYRFFPPESAERSFQFPYRYTDRPRRCSR